MNWMRPRWLASLVYVWALCASVVLTVFPGNSFREGLTLLLTITFHLFLGAGGFIGLVGAVKRTSAIEAMGIPLVATATFAYAVLLFIAALSGTSDSPGAASGVGFLLLCLATGQCGRLWECIKIMNIGVELHDRNNHQ